MHRSPLIHFLLLGGALFWVQSAFVPAAWNQGTDRLVVEVKKSEIDARLQAYRQQMGRAPTPQEASALESQVIDEAIWLEEAFGLGLQKFDPVVQQRLLLNMRFLENESGNVPGKDAPRPASGDLELLERAFELGMDRSDSVVQRRLIDRMQAVIRTRVRDRGVTGETLAAYYAENAEDWREPALFDLTHVYLSRDKHGDEAIGLAGKLLERLRREAIDPESAVALGDPFLSGHRLRGASPQRIASRLGPAFVDGSPLDRGVDRGAPGRADSASGGVFLPGVRDAPVGEWVGPVESAFGAHLVWIHDREPSRIPDLSEVENRVREDYFEKESREALREHLDQRRAALDVEIVDDEA